MVQLANLRLSELVKIVERNQDFFREFRSFLSEKGYPTIKDFIEEKSDARAIGILTAYMNTPSKAKLYDGISNPYGEDKAKWYFLAWLMRDAPAQRLGPLLASVEGRSPMEKRASLLNEVRKFVGPLFPRDESWDWVAISEVMLARLEGSRRSLKGNLFENIVRQSLRRIFKNKGLQLQVTDHQVKLEGETYDVEIIGKKRRLLMPVKTRETMGGGHASLFTRDIGKAIDVAMKNGYDCVPIVIAESWGGDLQSLDVRNFIHLKLNPNETERIESLLPMELEKLTDVFRKLND